MDEHFEASHPNAFRQTNCFSGCCPNYVSYLTSIFIFVMPFELDRQIGAGPDSSRLELVSWAHLWQVQMVLFQLESFVVVFSLHNAFLCLDLNSLFVLLMLFGLAWQTRANGIAF